ncbi:MAG: glycoside hydrolase, partial [Anaerotignum sp.]|nr:glycoside hydrolase [Anaerotignum sp.]
VEHDLERLRSVEFVPFEQAITAGTDFIMAGHIKTPNATTDDLPATLSSEMMGILRNDLGFDGIIITDAMNMGAIVDTYGSGESAVMAVQAGVDMVLMPANLQEAAKALTEAIKTGAISEERVEDALWRILSLKYDKGIL